MKGPILEISVIVREAAEEAVAAALEDLFNQTPSIYTDAETGKTAASFYLSKRSDWNPETQSRLAKALKTLRDSGIDIGPAKIEVKTLQRQDWAESWKKHFKPIHIGDALLIKPSWSKIRPRKNQACIVLDPGLSFGTGQHATTSFCLEQIVRCRRVDRSQSFLDIGTGSGILAIAAAKLGYAPVQAFDFDPESVRISRENAEQNGVGHIVCPARRDLTRLPVKSKAKFDLVCANLIHDVLLSEKEKIANRLVPTGSLVLAGILKTQFAEVQTAFEEIGLKLKRSKKEKEWRSGLFIFRQGH